VTGFRRTIVRPLDVEWAIAGKPPIGLIKIDIEGMEAEAITGAAELIERDRPVIVAEVAPNNVPQVCLILRQHGYTAERIKGDNFVFEQEENNAKKT